MNRQDSNNPLPLWGVLLVLPILLLAAYLHFNKSPVQNSPEIVLHNSVGVARVIAPLSTEAHTSIELKSPGSRLKPFKIELPSF